MALKTKLEFDVYNQLRKEELFDHDSLIKTTTKRV